MPINSESDSMGIEGTVAKVAASVMNPAPVTPLDPFEDIIATKEGLFAVQDLKACWLPGLETPPPCKGRCWFHRD